jgi:hypothetical protein
MITIMINDNTPDEINIDGSDYNDYCLCNNTIIIIIIIIDIYLHANLYNYPYIHVS